MPDIGLTHIALPITDSKASFKFYQRYANMQIVHRRQDSESGRWILWLSDQTRPFVLVLLEQEKPVQNPLGPFAHLGVACQSREELDQLCLQAKQEGILRLGPTDSGPPVGYWAFLSDPDGHTLELAYGQEVGLTVKEAKT